MPISAADFARRTPHKIPAPRAITLLFLFLAVSYTTYRLSHFREGHIAFEVDRFSALLIFLLRELGLAFRVRTISSVISRFKDFSFRGRVILIAFAPFRAHQCRLHFSRARRGVPQLSPHQCRPAISITILMPTHDRARQSIAQTARFSRRRAASRRAQNARLAHYAEARRRRKH